MGIHSSIYDEQDWFKYDDELYDKYLGCISVRFINFKNMDKFIWER